MNTVGVFDLLVFDVFVTWFPLLFGTFFVVSFIVDVLRKKGYLRTDKEMSKGTLAGVLLILGFNFVVAFPVILIGLIIEFTIGGPPGLELLLLIVMAIAEMIPIILSGIVAYSVLNGIYEKWGVSTGLSIVTGTMSLLVLIDTIGLLQPAMPFIVEAVMKLVMIPFEMVILWVLLAICLSKCIPAQQESEKSPSVNNVIHGNYSVEAALILLVGLGKRIYQDLDETALRALHSISKFNSQTEKVLTAAGAGVGVNLADLRGDRNPTFEGQRFSFTKERFGILKKKTLNTILLMSLGGLASAIAMMLLLARGDKIGFFLLVPAIVLLFVSLMVYQETSRFERGRHGRVPRSQFNSFLLTIHEFKSRVRLERALFAMNVIVLNLIIILSVTGTYITNPLWGAISVIVVLTGIVLARMDRLLTSKRLELQDIIERGLQYIGVPRTDAEGSSEGAVFDDAPYSVADTSISTLQVRSDWQKQLESQGHEKFARKVTSGSQEVYREHITIMSLGIGVFLVIIGVMLYSMFSFFESVKWIGLFGVVSVVIGAVFLALGGYRYRATSRATGLVGLNRKSITLLISYLDQRIQGVKEIGNITGARPPNEFINLAFIPLVFHTIVRNAVVKLQHRIPWTKETLDEIWATRSSYPKLEGTALVGSVGVFIGLYEFAQSIHSNSGFDFLVYVYLGLSGFIALTAIMSIVIYYREKRVLQEFIQDVRPTDDISYSDTLEGLLHLIVMDMQAPLRVLLIGNYPQVAYTGRIFFTTRGVEMREAVIIPQGVSNAIYS